MKILTFGLLLNVLLGIVLSKHQGSILSSILKPLDFCKYTLNFRIHKFFFLFEK